MMIKLVRREDSNAGSLRTYQYDRLGLIDVGFSPPEREGDAKIIALVDLHRHDRWASANASEADITWFRANRERLWPTKKPRKRRHKAAGEPVPANTRRRA
jgi:hypothetical protein